MEVIKIQNLTKDYGNNKGVFDISFSVNKGEVLGFLGPNGAGKTTTIRNILGFIKPDRGNVLVNGLDAFNKASEIGKILGYLPGEIAFINNMDGLEFLNFVRELKGINSDIRMKELIKFFELNPKGRIKKMSKGMKQKIAIICAFMGNNDIVVLDEPTSGLDPLMQQKFIELIKRQKEEGKTILMSSHIFEEIDKTCSRTVIIKNGRIVAKENLSELKKNLGKNIVITFKNIDDLNRYIKTTNYNSYEIMENKIIFNKFKNLNGLIKELKDFDIEDLDSQKNSLEDVFMHYYGGENND